MRILKRLLLTLILAIALAHALTIENQAKLARSTYVQINVTRTYQLTINETIIPELSEITGRQYMIELSHIINGIHLNENGDILTENEPSEETWEKEAIEAIEAKIVGDYARIEHIKKYGDESTETQNQKYIGYFQAAYGRMGDRHSSGKIKLEKQSEDIRIISSNEKPQEIIKINQSNQSQIVILKTGNTSNIFCANFSNASIQPGDTAYVVGHNQTTEKAIISRIENSTITLDRDIAGGSIILNEEGDEIGFALTDSKNAIGAAIIVKSSESAGGKNIQNQNLATYAQALEDLENNEYEKAIETLKTIIGNNPKEEIKNTYEITVAKSNEPANIIRKPLILGAIIAIIILGTIWAGKDKIFKKKESKGYSIRDKDFE
ncbi:hypothetical protein HY990_02945 [Candidatus Micrarchaeota archaeon]|nr:hypothetical protein [Candidatus Micrarchaeota archaeon]